LLVKLEIVLFICSCPSGVVFDKGFMSWNTFLAYAETHLF